MFSCRCTVSISRVSELFLRLCQTSKIYNGVSCFYHSFKFSDVQIRLASESERKPKPDPKNLTFGKCFSDHMLEIEWCTEKGWSKPVICPLHDLVFHPASKVLHYAQELFEGLKAFRSPTGKVLLFRPDLNVARLLNTAERVSLPKFDGQEFLMCLKKLISIDSEWVPRDDASSLYIRPTFIGTEPSLGITASKKALLYVITGPVGAYFPTGAEKPISLLADPKYVRSWPGGVGDKKLGCNYAPTIYVQKQAESAGHQQVLWLYGEDHRLVEVGTMNIFVYLINSNSEYELVTPPLDGLVLPGVIRRSLLDLANKWKEFKVSERNITMSEILDACNENRLLEIFGTGTACVVCPVGSITYMEKNINIPSTSRENPLYKRFLTTLQNIQYGKMTSDWSVPVD